MNLLRPVDKVYPISQLFGENPSWYPATKGHNGIDYSCPEGTPIRAAFDGTVVRAELDTATASNPKSGYGYHVRIQHPNGWTSVYGHFSQIQVKTGQEVQTGDIIGLSGNTGFSTGPHLHFEVRTGVAIQTSIDPINMIIEEVPSRDPIFTGIVTEQGDGLRVRSGPGTNFSIVRQLRKTDTIKVMGIAGGDVWLWTGDGYVKYQADWVTLKPAKLNIVINKRPRKVPGELQ